MATVNASVGDLTAGGAADSKQQEAAKGEEEVVSKEAEEEDDDDDEEDEEQGEEGEGEEEEQEEQQEPEGDDGGQHSTSDSEGLSEQLEVIFDKHGAQRRRASLTPGSKQSRPKNNRQTTSCFVHSLLEARSKYNPSTATPDDDLHKPADKNNQADASQGPQHTQSRLLTKKQLSDMAFGIRELSKKLGRIRLMLKVRNVFLLTKAHDQKLIQYTRNVAQWLLQQKDADGNQYTVWVEETMKDNKSFGVDALCSQDESYRERLKFWTTELCKKKPHLFEICLALGGDGTVLYASWLFQRIVPPVMSFALGSLGFLTKFDYGHYEETLTRAFRDGLTVSLRLRFEATIMRSTKKDNEDEQHSRDLVDELIGNGADDASTHLPGGTHNILNDIVMDRGPSATMSSIEMFGDEEHFTTVQADGVCVATPTGSTAYNLAAGGSLCHPDNPVILVTAIAPHTLSFRPIILPDTIVLRIGVPYDARASCWASFDGKERYATLVLSLFFLCKESEKGKEKVKKEKKRKKKVQNCLY